ncbi:MAG: S-adenosylmethionine:tRNA ribosyltransferase-isomerase [Candidatus Absconditabacterales bacterium]|nr:S-adenosylmethionine:tRNA ribosyltransferase-isomerase [Candidatus Absconditabacterales bacterium]
MSFHLHDYHFPFDHTRIAHHPCEPAHEAKMLICDLLPHLSFTDTHVSYLPTILSPQTILIANNSQTIRGRIPLDHCIIQTPQGDKTPNQGSELLVVRLIRTKGLIDQHTLIVWASNKNIAKPGYRILFPDGTLLISKHFEDDGIWVHCEGAHIIDFLDRWGDIPLPPYIDAKQVREKKHYLTSFGDQAGSVATPTAGLHFTPLLRQRLHEGGIGREEITLHVGIGTFAPITHPDIRQHTLHPEYCSIPRSLFGRLAQHYQHNKPLVTIGTTSTRVIESLIYLYPLCRSHLLSFADTATIAWWDKKTQKLPTHPAPTIQIFHHDTKGIHRSTNLFIYPGRHPTLITGIITNFHLPGTSLVMLVAGVMGYEQRRQSYDYALTHKYRRASFGDCMYIRWS